LERRDPVQYEKKASLQSERMAAIRSESREPQKVKPNRIAEVIAIFFVCLSSFLLFMGLKEYPQIFKSQNNIKTLLLKDSTSVTLKPKSSMSVSGHYLKETRTVYLYGDAYFQVRKEEKPFIVNTGTLRLQVDGTSFIVNAAAEDSVEVLVLKGEVTVFPNNNPNKDVTIKQGQKAVIYKNVNSIALSSFDSINALAWKDKIIVFNKTRLQDAIPTLEEYFKVKIELKNEAIGDCRISRTFNQPNVVEVMEELRRGLQLKMTREPGKFILEGKGCKFR
jgi:transmembrane sensor